MNKTIAALMFAGVSLFAAGSSRTFTGVITDSMCGGNHKMMGVTPDSKCVRDCVRSGSRYALYDGSHLYLLSDQKTPEKYAAEKVSVKGVLDQKTKTIQVESIAPAR